MALFRQSSDKSAGKDRDAAASNVGRLAVRLSEAQETVTASKGAAQSRALSGDDAGLDAAEVAEQAALRRLNTIAAAHAEAEQVLVKLDSEIAATLDKKTRVATAAETVALAHELVQAAASFDIAVTTLANASTRAALICFESTGLASFAASARIEVPAAVDVVSALLHEHSRMVLAGMAPATLPEAEAAFVPTVPAKPVTQRLFTLRAISWTDAEGRLRYVGRYNDADLPQETAARALSLKACVPIDDPSRCQNKGTWPGHPDPAQCFNLDDPPVDGSTPAPNEPVQFERVNRGPSYQLRVAGSAS